MRFLLLNLKKSTIRILVKILIAKHFRVGAISWPWRWHHWISKFFLLFLLLLFFFPEFFLFLSRFLVLLSQEWVHDLRKYQIKWDERAKNHHSEEENLRETLVASIWEVIHQVWPALKSQGLEYGQSSLGNIVEVCDVVEDQLKILCVIENLWIFSMLKVHVSAFCNCHSRRSMECTICITRAQVWNVVSYGPLIGSIIKLIPLLCLSAEVILTTIEHEHAKNGKNREEEYQEQAHIEQTWNGEEEGLYQTPHRSHWGNRLQRSQNPSCPQNLELLTVTNLEQTKKTNDHNSEVKNVPWVFQVWFLVLNKANCDYFEYALRCEYVSEDVIDYLNPIVPCLVSILIVVICEVLLSQQNWVGDDAEDDEVIKPLPFDKPY